MRYTLVTMICLVLAACGAADGPTSADAPPQARAEPSASAPAPVVSESPETAETGSAETPVIEQELAYGAAQDRNLVGLFALPEDVIEPLPGVIVIHDSRGLGADVRAAARRLAAAGYAVLAVDLYAGERPETPADAERLMAAVSSDGEATLSNLRQAYEYLNRYALAPRIGAVGWQLGGRWALEAGLEMGDELDAIVVYYGSVTTNRDRLATLSVPLLGLFAEYDESVPLSMAQSFRNTLRELGKTSQVLIYSDVVHGFAAPSIPSYAPDAAEEAWGAMLDFLDSNLK